MRTLITLAAIFAFGLHLLLGCCWHHAHGADELPGHQHDANGHHVHLPQWLSPAAAGCSHKHSHGEHDHEHPHSDDGPGPTEPSTPHAPCADPQCVYVVSSPVQVDAAHDVALPLLLIDLQLQPADLSTGLDRLAEHEKISPHLRRHLALSRLLN